MVQDGRVKRFVELRFFQTFIVVVIIANAIIMGLEMGSFDEQVISERTRGSLYVVGNRYNGW